MNKSRADEWRQSHINQTLENLNITRKDYKRFLIIGNKLHRLFEEQCNGYQDINGNWDEQATNESEAKELELRGKVCDMASEKNLYCYIQTDPRGATIYLDKEPIPYNNYTKAYCIY